MIKRDNLHFEWGTQLAYNKTWNFAVSEREARQVNVWNYPSMESVYLS